MHPIGDKVVLKKYEKPDQPSDDIILVGSGTVLCEVVAVGAGMPYGRGEFYAPVVKEGDLTIVPQKVWDAAPSVRLRLGKKRPHEYRTFHEREILMSIEESEL